MRSIESTERLGPSIRNPAAGNPRYDPLREFNPYLITMHSPHRSFIDRQ